jgi:hypothetical protein
MGRLLAARLLGSCVRWARLLGASLRRTGLTVLGVLRALMPPPSAARRTSLARNLRRRRAIAVDLVENFRRLLNAVRAAIAVELVLAWSCASSSTSA